MTLDSIIPLLIESNVLSETDTSLNVSKLKMLVKMNAIKCGPSPIT